MGFCISSNDKDERGVGNMGKMATGPSSTEINNDVLDMALQSSNPMNALKSKVSLTFSASDLPNLDSGSKTDPFIVLFELHGKTRKQVGTSEVIADSLNPEWVKNIDVDYFFETQQKFLIEVYDADDPNRIHDLRAHDFVGGFEFTLSKVVAGKNQELVGKLVNSTRKITQNATVKITAQEKKPNYGANEASFQIDLQSSTRGNVFIVVNKFKSPGKYIPVYKTETRPQERGKHAFQQIIIDTDTLCNDNDAQEIFLQVYAYNAAGNHKKISQGYTDLGSLKAGQGQPVSVQGGITINKFFVQPRVSFLDYIFGGCEIGVHVAIDYTMSNGPAQDPGSLHYLNPGNHYQNDYTRAIQAVMNILQDYDTDQMYPVYGFGGKLPMSPDQGSASHCFALNGDIFYPEVNGVQGVLNAYYASLNKVQFYGPTHFSSILDYVNGFCENQVQEISQQNQAYTVCLILTDGVINDIQKTIDEIVRGSDLPLSIIIIGVGQAEFQQMVELDGDVTPLFSSKFNKYRNRDIVQFVPFRDLQNNPMLLAKEVLAEMPRQMTDYFVGKGIKPNPKKMQDRQGIMIRNQMRNQMATMMRVANNYAGLRKEQCINKLIQMGFDANQVRAWLEFHGIAEENFNWIITYMQDQNYKNMMKLQ